MFYVMYPMKMFSYESDGFIENENCFLIYFILGKLSNFHDRKIVYCNVDLLESQVQLDKQRYRSKQKVVKALEELESKGYIRMDYEGDLTKSSFICIELIEDREETVSGGSVFKGFTKVYEDLFDKAEGDPMLFRILIYIVWRENIGYSISYKEWSHVLNVTEKTAIKLLNQYEEQRKIIIDRTEKVRNEQGQFRQGFNSYKVNRKKSVDEVLKIVRKANSA